jgi:hypothetical protein
LINPPVRTSFQLDETTTIVDRELFGCSSTGWGTNGSKRSYYYTPRGLNDAASFHLKRSFAVYIGAFDSVYKQKPTALAVAYFDQFWPVENECGLCVTGALAEFCRN